MLKLKLQYFGHLMSTDDSLEKPLILGKIEGRRIREHHGIRWLDDIMDVMNMNLDKLWEMVRDREAWSAVVHEIAKSLAAEQQQLPHLSMPPMFLPSLNYFPHPRAMPMAPGTGTHTHILQKSNQKEFPFKGPRPTKTK